MSPTTDVVVLRASGLGDLLTVVPALRALRRAVGDRHVTLLTRAPLVALAERTGLVDAARPVRDLADAPGIAARLAVNLHGAGPASHRLLLRTGARSLWAFRHPAVPASADGPEDPGPTVHESHRWLALLAAAGVEGPDDRHLDLDLDRDLDLAQVGTRAAAPAVIHPGAASAARRWPADRWAAVARRLARHLPVIVTGSSAEGDLVHEVARGAGLPLQAELAGRLDVVGLAAVIGSAALVCSGDTGVAHLASALGRPSVVLFGPVPPQRWGPPASGPHVVLWHGDPGRAGDPHGATLDPALARIEVDEVVAAAVEAVAAA